ncbi:MAG: glycosyltransferase, partial [bacterium]|nr:glycosyltransferase [bacterium]
NYFRNDYTRTSARKALKLEAEAPVVLFFGYIRQYKGLHVLLAAMPRVLKTISVKLLVAGEFYDPKDKYDKLIKELGIGDSVQIF